MQVSEVTPAPNPNEYVAVKRDLTSKTNYKLTLESAERRELIFQKFIAFFISQYSLIKQFSLDIKEHDYLVFNNYILDAFEAISECLGNTLADSVNSQARKLEDITHNPDFMESLPLECTLYEAQKIESQQDQLLLQIKEQQEQMGLFLETCEKHTAERQKTLNFFSPTYMKEPYVELSKLYHFIEETDQKNRKLILRLEKSKIKFLSSFGTFRKIAVRNRMLFEKKFNKICAVQVDGVVSIFSTLLKKVKAARDRFNKSFASLHSSKSADSQVEEDNNDFLHRISVDELFSICSFLKNIAQMMLNLLKRTKEQRAKFIKTSSTMFRVEDCFPAHTLSFVMETLDKILSRFVQIANNLTMTIQELELEETRLSNQLGKSTVNSTVLSGVRKPRISEKVSSIPHIIGGIFEDFIDPLTKLAQWTETSLSKEKKTHIDESQVHDLNRMSVADNGAEVDIHQNEQWMWEEWKENDSLKLPDLTKIRAELGRMKTLADPSKKPEGKQIMEPQKCHLITTPSQQKKGIFYTYENCVKFISSQDDYSIVVQYEALSDVKVKLQVFKLNMFLYTPKGKICLVNPPRAIKCKQKISERIKKEVIGSDVAEDEEGNTSTNQIANAPKWKPVELSPEEVSGMEARKAKVLAEFGGKGGCIEMQAPFVFKSVSIDQVYFELYSDVPKEIGGKKYNSFNHYNVDFLQNKNIEDTKFTSKGPKFYTREEGSNFESCPSFSERTTSYDHSLGTISIPFMPKFCKCKESIKLFWVSHEEFIYSMEARSSGAPMTDSFFVKYIHHAKKVGVDVEVSYWAQIVFVKDTSFKKLLENKCMSEVKDNLPKTIRLMTNRIRSLNSGGKTDSTPEEAQIEEIEKKSQGIQKQESAKSPVANPNIIYLIGGVILFLVVVKLIKVMLR